MKKTFLFLVILLFGCVNASNTNNSCINTRTFKIFQALDNGGALAHECTFWDGCSSFNQLVYLEWQPGIRYYDGMVLKLQSNKCAIVDDVYRYTTAQGFSKTVPSIKIDYKNPPSSEEELFVRIEEFSDGVYKECLHDFKINNNSDGEKFCKCATDTIFNYFYDLTSKDNVEYSQEVFESKIEEECGKFPKFYNK